MDKAHGITLGVLQPGYFPWLGFFDQMSRVDVFVLYDDVQFDKHGWRNRNRVKSHTGPTWLSVPIRHKGLGQQQINEVEIDNQTTWGRKHLSTIRQLYSKAPYLNKYLPELEVFFSRHWTKLVELDIACIELMQKWFGITTQVVQASSLGIAGGQSERLLNFCLHFGAQRYLSGNAAENYLDLQLFTENNVLVEWQNYQHPTYPQLHGEFISHLSALDMVLNCGEGSHEILTQHLKEEGL